MEMMEKLLGLEGYRIKFTCHEGDYEGTISVITPEIQLLIIKKLIWLPKNSKMGTLTFRAKEIKAFEIICREEMPQPMPEQSYSCAIDYTRKTEEVPTLFDELEDSITVVDSEFPNYFDEDEEKELFKLKLPPSLTDVLPLDNVVINELDNDFYDSVRHMKKQDVIGISLESPKVRRNEELHWLCISTQCCTFFFDVHMLGKEGFSKGLKDILEDPRIEKVLHNCREASDCLYHSVNIFDTEVADFVINHQRRRDCRIYNRVNSLNSCLANYLDIPDEFLYRPKRRSYQDDLVFYGLRPVPDEMKNLFIKNVIYLRELKKEVNSRLIEPTNRFLNVYINTLKKLTDLELQLEMFTPDDVPDELLDNKLRVFRFQEHVDIPTAISSGPPYRKIDDCFKDFLTYCKKHGIGEQVKYH